MANYSPRQRLDLTGQRFGRLVVIERAEDIISPNGARIPTWKCQCDCGNTKVIRQPMLRCGNTKSCGCIHKEQLSAMRRTHGFSGNKDGRLYPLWKSIKYRCFNPNCKSYKNYGGRGITMCPEWANDYMTFRTWALANGYSQDQKTDKGINVLTIDRIDNDGNYEPGNCRFVTNAVQATNTRKSMSDDEKYAICPVCGKEYRKSQRNGEKTCSCSCGRKWYHMNHPNTRDYTRICPVCGKTFIAKDHYEKRIHCSRKCASKSISLIWEYNGESHRVVEWAEIIGINAHCLYHRKEMGWTIEEILKTPLRGKRSELQKNICNQTGAREQNSQSVSGDT